jgi:hypothetical protein
MKLNSLLVFLVTTFILFTTGTQAGDVLTLDDGFENTNSITWPMLPGESIEKLAAKFYPKNKVMQRHFTAKVISLNAETMPKLSTKEDFSVPTAVVIPTLKSLSYSAQAIKSAHSKSNQQDLHMSYNMIDSVRHVPKSLLDEYDYLVTRNTFLKEELVKLNKKLTFLQSKLNNLKLILDKSLSLPNKKSYKNLDAKIIQSNPQPTAKPVEKPNLVSKILNSTNMNAILASILMALVASLATFLIRNNHKKTKRRTLLGDLKFESSLDFDDTWQNQKKVDTKTGVPLNTNTLVDNLNEVSILD